LNNAEKNMEKNKPMTVEEATRAIYDATNNMRWTSVKDKLPASGQDVLVWLGDHMDPSVHGYVAPNRWIANGMSVHTRGVSHWMPLPNAPQA